MAATGETHTLLEKKVMCKQPEKGNIGTYTVYFLSSKKWATASEHGGDVGHSLAPVVG